MARGIDQLLCAERCDDRKGERDRIERNEFDADGDKIAYLASFRVLGHKTQVFDQVTEVGRSRNRLTHTIEASRIARSFGVAVGARMMAYLAMQGRRGREPFWRIDPGHIGSVCAAAAMAHDVGLPPLGHVGEEAIAEFVREGGVSDLIGDATDPEDLRHHEGNAQNLRLLTRIEGWRGRRGGAGLTMATLAASMKYPYPRREGQRKFGCFAEDEKTLEEIADRTGMIRDQDRGGFKRHPLAYLVEASDDLAYLISDIEDAVTMRVMTDRDVEALMAPMLDEGASRQAAEIEEPERRIVFMRSRVVRRLIDAVVDAYPQMAESIEDGSLDAKTGLLGKTEFGGAILRIREVSRERIYKSEKVASIRRKRVVSMKNALARLAEGVRAADRGDRQAADFLESFVGWRMSRGEGCRVRRIIDTVTLLGDADIVELGN